MDHGKIIAEGTKEELTSLIADANLLWVTLSDTAFKVDTAALAAIRGVTHAEIEDSVVKVTSEREINILQPVISYFASAGIPIKNIESKQPDLETVFLSLTGRGLRN